jgi:hypothetical protein
MADRIHWPLRVIAFNANVIWRQRIGSVKLTTVQVTKLPLQHEIRNIGMICSVKPVLTEDLCVVQKEEIFNNMLCMRNVHLTKG